MEPVLEPAGAVTLIWRQRCQQFQLGRRCRAAESERGGSTGHANEEQRGRLLLGEAGEAGAVAVDQAVSPGAALLGVHRNSGGRERLDVAVDRALRDVELLREFARREPVTRLEQEEDR